MKSFRETHSTHSVTVCVIHGDFVTLLSKAKRQMSKSKNRRSHYECFASRRTRAKPVFISNQLVAAWAVLLPIKRQDRPVSLGLVWPSKSTFITASGEGPIR